MVDHNALDKKLLSPFISGGNFPTMKPVRMLPVYLTKSHKDEQGTCTKYQYKGRALSHGVLLFMCQGCHNVIGY